MKTLYLDLSMGAAGDMLSAALLELLPEPDAFVEKLNAAGIPGVRFEAERSVKCGVTGTHMKVTVHGVEEGEEHSHHHEHHDHGEHAHDHADHPHDHGDHPHDHGDHAHDHGEHHHGSPGEIAHIVNGHLNVPDRIKKDVLAVYSLIAEAESAVHGVPVTDVHFHEVGAMDALADVTAVCMLIDALAPDEIAASPVHVGSGSVKCAHGILPVPAPATALLLRGVPTYGGRIDGELCTPTGAALVRHFVGRFGDMPVLAVERIGYGMGKKDFPQANCVRAMLGETAGGTDGVLELSFNVDDMTAEEIGFAVEMIFDAGAREVFTVPVGMKKNRPGTLVDAICDAGRRSEVIAAIFRHTTTIGVRENALGRYVLDRRIEQIQTEYGAVRRKTSSGYGVTRSKLEYDDVARIARERGVSLREARELIEREAGEDR